MARASWVVSLALLATAVLLAHGQSVRNVVKQQVPFGGKVSLTCNSADGTPTFWRVPPRSQRVAGNVVRVVMDSASKYGNYRCYTQRPGSAATLGRTVRITRPVTSIDLEDSMYIVTLGSPFVLNCPVNFGPRNTNWFRFDKARQTWSQVRRRSRSTFQLRRVTQYHITVWRCEAANGVATNGVRSAAMVLNTGYVTSPKARLTAQSEMGSEIYLVRQNRNKFVLECEPVRGQGGEQIVWEFKNPRLPVANPENDGYVSVSGDPATANVQVQSASDFSVLEINKCQTQNSGFYRCKLPNGSKRYARLQVQRKTPEIHRFGKSGVRKKLANKREKVVFHCALDMPGVTAADLYWTYQPKGSENDPASAVEYRVGPAVNGIGVGVTGGRSRLTIANAQKSHEGRYFCRYNDVSDYTDLSVGAGFEAKIMVTKSYNSFSIRCVITKNGVTESSQYYRIIYYEQKNGRREVLRSSGRLPRFRAADRNYLCVATSRRTSKAAESMPYMVKGVSATLTAQTPTGLRQGAPLTLQCEVSDTSIQVSMASLTLNNGRAPFASRSLVRPGVVAFKFNRVIKRNTGDYRCVVARTIKSNAVKVAVCLTTERLCRDMSLCYPVNKKCDGRRDCADGSDEDRNQCMDCEPHSLKCGIYKRRRPDVKCVLKHWICDGQNDCGNGWDEFVNNGYCNKHPLPTANCPGCGRNESCCADGRCFPRAYECDIEKDCPADNSDENGCSCGEASQLEIDNPLVEETKSVSRGDNLELTCQIRGKERATINWRFNWGHLPDDVRFVESMSVTQVLPEGLQGGAELYTVVGKLSIKNVNPRTDIGRYTCEAVTKCKRRLAPDYILSLEPELP